MIYLATRPEAIYVLHAFQKKTQQTSKRDLNIATTRFREATEQAMTGADDIPGQVFASVWDALEDSLAEARNMRLRSAADNRTQTSGCRLGADPG